MRYIYIIFIFVSCQSTLPFQENIIPSSLNLSYQFNPYSSRFILEKNYNQLIQEEKYSHLFLLLKKYYQESGDILFIRPYLFKIHQFWQKKIYDTYQNYQIQYLMWKKNWELAFSNDALFNFIAQEFVLTDDWPLINDIPIEVWLVELMYRSSEKNLAWVVFYLNTLLNQTQINKAILMRELYKYRKQFFSLLKDNFSYSVYNQLIDKMAEYFSIEEKKIENEFNLSDLSRGAVSILVNEGFKIENGQSIPNISFGSGFFIDKNGYLVTNYHVIHSAIQSAQSSYVSLKINLAQSANDWIPAKVISYHKELDLALLKVNIIVPYVFSFAYDSSVEVGERIYAIGSPLGLRSTVTSGIISAINRPSPRPFAYLLQIDASLNEGNSGGPIVNQKGEVIAISVLKANIPGANVEGLGFAIPIKYFQKILWKLYHYPQVKLNWLGLALQEEPKEVRVLYPFLYTGASVYLERGDQILQIDQLVTHSIETIFAQLLSYEAEELILMMIQRDKSIDNIILFISPKPPNLMKHLLASNTVAQLLYPYFGLDVLHTGNNKYRVLSVVKGSMADQLGILHNSKIMIIDYHIEQVVWLLIILVEGQFFSQYSQGIQLFSPIHATHFI